MTSSPYSPLRFSSTDKLYLPPLGVLTREISLLRIFLLGSSAVDGRGMFGLSYNYTTYKDQVLLDVALYTCMLDFIVTYIASFFVNIDF